MIAFAPYTMRADVDGNGTCWLLYVHPQGGMANDIFTFVRESDGGAVHVQTGQFKFCINPTLEIRMEEFFADSESTQPHT